MRRFQFAALLVAASLGPGATEAQAPPPGGAAPGFTEDLIADLERVGRQLVSLAEAIPAERYGWRPAEGVRSVSEVYMHVVGSNLLLPPALGAAPAEGFAMPADPQALAEEWERTVVAKEDVVGRLRDSFSYAAEALATIPPERLEDEVNFFGFPASKRAYMLIILTHAHEHLGQSIAYARSVGVVPPWSRPQGEDGGPGG